MSTLARLGQGLGLPLYADEAGQLPLASGPEKVRQAIFTILDTEPGERVMLPEFGCGLRRFLMEPNSVGTRARIQHEATIALQRWEPRIALASLTVLPGADPALLLVEVQYTHIRDGRRDSLVYPFYLE